MNSELNGKVVTALGPVAPGEMGAVLMHEHLHSDWAQVAEEPFDMVKWPVVEKCALPYLRRSREHGCFAYVDMSRPPERAAPWVYRKVSEMSGVHIIVTTGYYREIELGMFTHTLPRFREMGITEDMIRVMMVDNPKRVMPVRL